MLGRILLAGLLSAALIAVPKPSPAHFNNSTHEKAVEMSTVMPTEKGYAEVANQAPDLEASRKVELETQPAQAKVVVQELTDKEQLMQAAGVPESDWGDVDFIISRESTWRVQISNSSSGAYGLCQALPGNKMASAGADWETNPITQLRWCHSYALDRYGSWAKAKSFWLARVPINGRDVGHWW